MMPIVTAKDLKTLIKENRLSSVYFLFGSEKYLIKYYSTLLVDTVLDGSARDFNYHCFDTTNFDINALYDAVEGLPFMSAKKCVRISDLDIEKLDADTVKKLGSMFSDLPESSVLIVEQGNVSIDTKKSPKWRGFIKLLEKCAAVVELNKLSRPALIKQLTSWCRKLSCELPSASASLLIDLCGDSLDDLKSEIEKLCAYRKSGQITKLDILLLVSPKLEANVFELTRAVSYNNLDSALSKLDVLLGNREEPIAILAVLSAVYVDLYRVKVASDSAQPITTLSELFDYRGKMFRLDIAARIGQNLSISVIRESLFLLMQADMRLKGSGVDSRVILEQLLVKLFLLSRH